MICHKGGFYFQVDPWKCDTSPCVISKGKPSSRSRPPSPPVPPCSPGVPAQHSGRLWRWSEEAERALECGGLACKHTRPPLTEKCRNKAALTFCYFLPPLPIIHQAFRSASVCPQPLTHAECPRSKVGSGGVFAFTWKSEGYNYGAHYWLSDKRRSRRGRIMLWHKAIWWGGWGICCILDSQSSVEHAYTVNLWALRQSFSWQNSHCVLLCYLSLLYFTHEDTAESGWQFGTTSSSAASPRWRGNILKLLYTGRPVHVKQAAHCALAVTDFLCGLKITAHLLWVVLFVGGNWNNVLLLLLLWAQREAENTVSGQSEGKKCVANVCVLRLCASLTSQVLPGATRPTGGALSGHAQWGA